jgi:hypothetical protein
MVILAQLHHVLLADASGDAAVKNQNDDFFVFVTGQLYCITAGVDAAEIRCLF